MSSLLRKSKPSRRAFLAAGILAAVPALSGRSSAVAAEEKKLRVFNWDNYVGSTTLSDFTAATGIEVTMDIYGDDNEIIQRMNDGTSNYDVVVPSSDVLEQLIEAGQVLPLDHSRLPNLANVDKSLLDAAFDRGRKYAIPYTWGTIGIGYRKSVFSAPPDSWKLLYESSEFANRITLMDDSYNALGCGLKYLGYSFNSVEPDELKEVQDLLVRQKKNLKAFAPTEGQDYLLAGETVVCQEWNGDIAEAMRKDNDISYSIPAEGSVIWQDVMAIPLNAPHPVNAHVFLNFVLDAENGKHIAETIQYATPNAAARALMDPAYVENPAIFPPGEIIAKCEPGLYLGEEGNKLREDIWAQIKAT